MFKLIFIHIENTDNTDDDDDDMQCGVGLCFLEFVINVKCGF